MELGNSLSEIGYGRATPAKGVFARVWRRKRRGLVNKRNRKRRGSGPIAVLAATQVRGRIRNGLLSAGRGWKSGFEVLELTTATAMVFRELTDAGVQL
jgi:hypothetical protein